MIERLNNSEVYNPIGDHIKVSFVFVSDSEKITEIIAKDLKVSGFSPKKSCVLIFAPTRRLTEETTTALSDELEKLNFNFYKSVDYYHAGLESNSREEKYQNIKNGKTSILVATKAFGMGMDIDNIHYIYHLGPSSSFEDYLQEVGRAGRNKDKRENAGFNSIDRVQAKCLYTRSDFQALKDKQHKSQMTWAKINQVKDTVFSYLSTFKELKVSKEDTFPLPLDLLDTYPEFSDINNKDTFFRISLYWLEKLERIKLGAFTPTHLPIFLLNKHKDLSFVKTELERNELLKLTDYLTTYKKEYFPDKERIMIDIAKLKVAMDIKSSRNIYKLLFKAQRAKILRIDREINLEPTKLRIEELQSWGCESKSPSIEALFDIANQLINETKPLEQLSIDNERLQELFKEQIDYHFIPKNIFWKEFKNSNKKEKYTTDELTEKHKKDFSNRRSKFTFKTLSFLKKIKYKQTLEFEKGYNKPIINHLLYNGYQDNKKAINDLYNFKKHLYRLIDFVSKKYIKHNIKKFNIVDLMIKLQLEEWGEVYFQNLLFISKGLGFLKGEGKLVPMGVEMSLSDLSEINSKEIGSKDYEVEQEFIESNKMKELRLLALEALSNINDDSKQENFIKDFFKCGSLGELIGLLEDYIGENHTMLLGFKEEALKSEKEKLNESQSKVYSASIKKNIQVIAGPGSGKTHTLTLRVARLIQEEKIQPENILILAYNRAVVVELKNRLTTLFKALGYSRLINRLRVFTFHGFIKFCIAEHLEGIDFKGWTPKFLQIIEESPGLISQKLGTIKYVFVDEFQDITSNRLQLLQAIADPKHTKVCVIGDPNQSIYGYERADEGDPIHPNYYYYKFKEIYKPSELNLAENYRSYPEIIEEAEKLLDLNETKFPLPKLKTFNDSNGEKNVCEIIDANVKNVKWIDRLQEILVSMNNPPKYEQIAIMFRSNKEVFRAYNNIAKLNLTNIRIRIQGAKGSIFRSREFYYYISKLKEKGNLKLPTSFVNEIESYKNKVLNTHPNWDKFLLDVFHALVIEYEKEKNDDDTYLDLIDFIQEITSNDEGHYGKIYKQNKNRVTNESTDIEIVLTTMHKVKGLEFDVVIIPPSFSNLPLKESSTPLEDLIEEERRLYYVAYTRAKKKLIVIKYKREHAIDNDEGYIFPEEFINNNLGIPIEEGIDKFKLYWGASNYGGNSFSYLENQVKIGDAVELAPQKIGGFVFWHAIINNTKVAQLSSSMADKLNHLASVKGLIVSSIQIHTYEETVRSDEEWIKNGCPDKNGRPFSEKWTENSKNRGYIYLVDFSGYGKYP